ncbi:related to c-module-binding factor [Rhynchosporium graminicola]|uniref:Related to c-module-binding factor n=1 Tax=Rhynchosporium graminicola TaxID=2792576 RepID=A0A1E1JQT5_9HELO|nr:related to c-module-binding factor [Rhynchosporium commune]
MAPGTHPQAQFVPISPDFNLETLVESTDNFDYVTRLSTEKLKEHSIQSFEALILAVVIQSGKPLVIEDWGESLPPWLFSREWLESNLGTKPEQVRDIPNEVNIPMTMGHYLRSMGKLTNQFTKDNFRDPKRQRLYLKDIDCPDAWSDQLKSAIPECVFYLNDCIESRTGGDGAILEPNEYGQMRYGKGVAPAGDLMSSLPPEMRALNMMCYIGHEGTYTPTHREMCATLGHNIMVETSDSSKGEKEGSSLWFMTETKERELVSEYFLSMLGHDVEVEKHFAQVNAWKKAPFNVWVVEQRKGDLILIPPLAPHQVWNRGTRTMKAAWNRTTVDTLELALHEALPRGRMVCRDEQYKCKAIVYYTLVKYYDLLQRDTIEPKMWKYGRIKQLLEDFRRLFSLWQEILVSEMFSPKLPEETDVEMVPFDSNITCSYCRLNIFNRFLTCKSCILYGTNGEEDTYDICMDCYAMGRSCACISALSWVEQWDWNVLVENYELWRGVVVQFDGFFDTMRSPQVLDVARKRYGRKPIAEVCQEQLRRRPWTDITKPKEMTPDMSDVEPEVDDEGRIKRRKGKKAGPIRKNRVPTTKGKTHSCHICFHQEWNWKLAFCTTCNSAYCYGVLWRAFDLMPQTVMEDKDWQCPRCLKICSCSKCRKGGVQKAYQPKGTLLGHDTRRVADYRSVESLVDFSRTNLSWLKNTNDGDPEDGGRMKKLKEKAEAEKARIEPIDDSYLAGEGDPFAPGTMDTVVDAAANTSLDDHAKEMQDIDPSLRGPAPADAAPNGDGQHRIPYDPPVFTPNPNGHEEFNVNMGEDIQNAWMGMDGNYEFDGYDSTNPQPAKYPSRLLAPVAPMLSTTPIPARAPTPPARPLSELAEPAYPDPSHVGQNRMMGIGYYQQGDGIDKIVYDPPNMNDSEPSQPTLAHNPNLALSDLLDPALQPEIKKRKRIGQDDVTAEEEFFTSKRQKKAAMIKRGAAVAETVESDIARPEKRLPRRSAGQVGIYTDLGEDAVPIEEDEANLLPAYDVAAYSRKRKSDKPEDDLELAAKAINNFSGPSGTRARPRGPARERASNTIKTPRKSAWLTRKAADHTSAEVPDNQSAKRVSSRRSDAINDRSSTNSEVAGVPIESASDSDDGGVAINYSDSDESDKDSLFGDPVVRVNKTTKKPRAVNLSSGEDESPRGQSSSSADPSEKSDFALPQQSVKRRGRPPKQQKADSDSDEAEAESRSTPKPRGRAPKKAVSQMDLRSPSPNKSARPKMLSLKEKLALKGKSIKIVSNKAIESANAPYGPFSARSTPSTMPRAATMPKSILKQASIEITLPSYSANKATHTLSSSQPSPVTTPANLPSSKTTSVSVAPPPSPQRKGPTVVRLVSPDSESEDDARPPVNSSGSGGSSDDDGDIPAVLEPKVIRGTMAVRGRGRPRGRPAGVRLS